MFDDIDECKHPHHHSFMQSSYSISNFNDSNYASVLALEFWNKCPSARALRGNSKSRWDHMIGAAQFVIPKVKISLIANSDFRKTFLGNLQNKNACNALLRIVLFLLDLFDSWVINYFHWVIFLGLWIIVSAWILKDQLCFKPSKEICPYYRMWQWLWFCTGLQPGRDGVSGLCCLFNRRRSKESDRKLFKSS